MGSAPERIFGTRGGAAHAINDKGQILVSTACAAWAIWDQGAITEIAPPDNSLSITRLVRINNNGQAVGYGTPGFGTPGRELCGGVECGLVVNFESPD